jgi:dihydrofolate reductase
MIVGDYSARKAHPVLMPSSTGVRFLPGQSATPKLLFAVSWLSSQISVEVAWSPLTQLLGRVTYEGFAAAWPQRSGDPFSEKFNSMPKYVISHTLKKADWNNSTILKGNVLEEVSKLKQTLKGDILVSGSARLVQTLIANDLVDQLNLMVFPVVLGSGKRLFGDTSEMKTLRLAQSKPVGDGVLILVYRPA